MRTHLVTGGSGFFGDILKRMILESGDRCISVDLVTDSFRHANLTSHECDIRDTESLESIIAGQDVSVVHHCAALLAHDNTSPENLWSSNVDGTRSVLEIAQRHGIQKIIFTSSNCLWGRSFGRPVLETDHPEPVEEYGRSKLKCEEILLSAHRDLCVTIFRCPTIVDEGRLGLLAILFEFIAEGRRIWLVGGGKNVYQFIYAKDLATACLAACNGNFPGIFNIGSDEVKPLRDVFQHVIEQARTGSRLVSVPKTPTLAIMRVAHKLRLSPLGPYQYRMIAEDFTFDTSKLKKTLNWAPTVRNEEMLWRAYKYYSENREDIMNRQDVSAHHRAAKMGIIRLLKLLS